MTTWSGSGPQPTTAWRADPHDLAGSCVRFGRLLREQGVRVAPEQAARWLQALDRLGVHRPEALYWSGRVTLCADPAHLPVYDALFYQFWLTLDHPALGPDAARESREVSRALPRRLPAAPQDPGDPGESEGHARPAAGRGAGAPGINAWLARYHPQGLPAAAPEAPEASDAPEGPPQRGLYSAAERLREKDFARFSPADRAALARLLGEAGAWWAPRLRSRRRLPAHAGGRLDRRRPDLRRTLALAARTGGDPVRLLWQARRLRWRRWVFLCDISASMSPYTEALLLFLHAVAGRRPNTEVFLFGTRLTRITPQLRRSRGGEMGAYLQAVRDWHGGTRLGEALHQFLRRYGRRGLAHGALLVILSDGLDQGEGQAVGDTLAQLRRLACRIAWANPLNRSPRYAPAARAMAAALPFLDDFTSGHNLESLVALLIRQADAEL